jgi:hypothetical protein
VPSEWLGVIPGRMGGHPIRREEDVVEMQVPGYLELTWGRCEVVPGISGDYSRGHMIAII